MPKYGEFVETRFHELENESKMRLLTTYSPTSERQDYEADKERQGKGIEGGLSARDRKNAKQSIVMSPEKGGRGDNASMEKRKTEVARQPWRGGQGKIIPPKKTKQEVTVL